MIYNYSSIIQDFAKRTKDNSTIVEKYKGNEITQFVNSLMGLLILPYEKYGFGHKNGKNENQLKKFNGYDKLEEKINSLHYVNTYSKDNHTVNDFLFHMRNAFAHSGNGSLYFYPYETDEKDNPPDIEGVILYDTNNKNGKFIIKLSINQLKELVDLITNLYSEIENSDQTEFEDKFELYKEEASTLESELASAIKEKK